MEKDYRLFQLVKRNPINNCVDLSKNIIGRRDGVFYFTQHFRIDFENKMHEIGRLKEENENLLLRLKQLEEENKNMAEEYLVNNPGMAKYLNDNYIFKSKIESKIKVLETLQKEFPNNEELRIKIIAYKELLGR